MRQIIISIVGALLVLQVLKLVIPEGTVKKYASFIVCATVMLILTASVLGTSFSLPEKFDDYESQTDYNGFSELCGDQTKREFSRQLDTDMKKSIPELKDAELSFDFDISENNTGYVTHMLIKSENGEDTAVKNRISELYMIPLDAIEWRKT